MTSKNENMKNPEDAEVEKIEKQPEQQIKYWIGGKHKLEIMFKEALFSLEFPSAISLIDLGEYSVHLKSVVEDLAEKAEENAKKLKEEEEKK